MGAGAKVVAVGVAAVVMASGVGKDHHGHVHGAAAQAVAYVQSKLGDPYVWGAAGPDEFDCSGLTEDAYDGKIPRTSEEQWAAEPHVSGNDLQPGDLVFTYWDVDSQAAPNHVQMYVGHGDVIGADTTDVEQTPLSEDDGHIIGYAQVGGA